MEIQPCRSGSSSCKVYIKYCFLNDFLLAIAILITAIFTFFMFTFAMMVTAIWTLFIKFCSTLIPPITIYLSVLYEAQ
jgi:hypothetical protein